MAAGRILGALVVASACFAGGVLFERGSRASEREPDLGDAAAGDRQIRKLEAKIDELTEQLAQRPLIGPPERVADSGQRPARVNRSSVASVRARIAGALRVGDGAALLAALSDLAALGEPGRADLVSHWTRLANLDVAGLDRLGLSKIALMTALAGSRELLRLTLTDGDLDANLRQLSATALENAPGATRRAVVDTLDFSDEKDRHVLASLLRIARAANDPIFVERFAKLVARTDLYNDTRSGIAFSIAEIGGSEARNALDLMQASPRHKRIAPVLESIYDPPRTGLLVTNGFPPGASRIGLNDIILSYNGEPIRTGADLARADNKTKTGQVVAVKVYRNGAEIVIHVEVTNTAPGHLHFDSRPIVRR